MSLLSGAASIDFTLSNQNDFPTGGYKVDISHDDKLDRTLPFQIQ